jgi:hypothetical protein
MRAGNDETATDEQNGLEGREPAASDRVRQSETEPCWWGSAGSVSVDEVGDDTITVTTSQAGSSPACRTAQGWTGWHGHGGCACLARQHAGHSCCDTS